DHPNTLTSMHGLAGAYRAAGKLDKAVPLFEETLEKAKRKLGPDDPHTLGIMRDLITAYLADKQPGNVIPLLYTFLDAQRRQPGTTAVGFARLLASLGTDLLRNDRPQEAERLFRECLAIREKKLPDDWLRFNALSMLGGALATQKKFTEA